MSSHHKLVLALLLLTACHGKIPSAADDDKFFLQLIDSVNNEKLSFQTRLAATKTAYTLASAHRNITQQIRSINERGILYWRMDSADQAMTHFRIVAQMAKTAGDTSSLGTALNNIGLIFSERTVYDSAVFYYQQADKAYRSSKDSLHLVQCHINTGIAYKNLGAFEKAFSMTTEAAHIMQEMNGTLDLATAYNTLGNTLKDLHRPQEALMYHNRAIGIRHQLKDSVGIAQSLNNIGNVYKTEKQYARALEYFLPSLDLKKKWGSKKSRLTTMDNITETYLGLGQLDLAERYGREALALRNEAEDRDGWMTSANQLARIYLARDQPDSAQSLALHIETLSGQPIYLRQQLENALLFENIYLKKKDYPDAVKYAGKALTLKDSLFNSDLSSAISTMNARFRAAEQQKALEIAEKNDIIQVQQIHKQKYFIVLLASIVILLLVITYLLYVSNRLRRVARERTELLMSELNHRVKNNLQLTSDILNLQSLTTEDPQQIELIETARNRVQSISIVHNLLYKGEYTGNINMPVFISEIANNISLAFQDRMQKIKTSFSIGNISLNADQAIPLGLIINELLTNVYKYNRAGTTQLLVGIQMTLEEERISLLITDTGSTWDIDAARQQKKGLGLLLTDMLTRQLKASWESFRMEQKNIHRFSFQKI